jgi:hypothetical protein
MRFMMIVKATKDSEAGMQPSAEMLMSMGAYNEQLAGAGILREAAGLQSSAKGARVAFANGEVVVTDGPFTETKELIAGFWIIEVASKAEAVAWAKKCPAPHGATPTHIEIRQLFSSEDFTEATPEFRAHEAKLEAAVKASR